MGSGAGEVLVHICCAPCATYCIKKLREDGYEPVGFFYNPNIYPQEEYEKRLKETQKIKNNFKFQLITGKYDTKTWSDYIRGFEHEPEGGKRCNKCFELRLKKTAKTAKEMNIKYFTTTLTVSPHKNVEVILQLGRELIVTATFRLRHFLLVISFSKSCVFNFLNHSLRSLV